MKPPVVIVGASTRAAAQSALRAGFTPWAMDLFGDEDLREIASFLPLNRYPYGTLRAFAKLSEMPWMYTGALENYPRLIGRLSRVRRLWGNAEQVVREVRDPLRLGNALHERGLAFPQTLPVADWQPGLPGQWLFKPKRTAGGNRIQAMQQLTRGQRAARSGFAQAFVPGRPCSAVYVAAGGKSTLLGLTWQRIGENFLRADGFKYCGSTGPVSLTERDRAALIVIGESLAEAFLLQGLFGIDLIRCEADCTVTEPFTVIEVNPRYTASVEVLERSLIVNALALHQEACTVGRLPEQASLAEVKPTACVTKGILFAKRPVVIRPAVMEVIRRWNEQPLWPVVADIPAIGTRMEAGWPIVTLFAESDEEASASDKLHKLTHDFETLLYRSE